MAESQNRIPFHCWTIMKTATEGIRHFANKPKWRCSGGKISIPRLSEQLISVQISICIFGMTQVPTIPDAHLVLREEGKDGCARMASNHRHLVSNAHCPTEFPWWRLRIPHDLINPQVTNSTCNSPRIRTQPKENQSDYLSIQKNDVYILVHFLVQILGIMVGWKNERSTPVTLAGNKGKPGGRRWCSWGSSH